MKSCDKAPQHFIEFCSFAQNFSSQRIKILCVDNAPELVRGKLEVFCKTEGIAYEKLFPTVTGEGHKTLSVLERGLSRER